MTEAILLTVPARHLQPGDHTHGFVVSRMKMVPGRDATLKQIDFRFVVPHTTHYMDVTVREEDLDGVSFPLTQRGDDYNPNPRNTALGLPPVPPPVYTEPAPVAVYPAGTLMQDVHHFDRSMKVVFHCPDHPENVAASKDPFVSSWFWIQGDPCGCMHHVGLYIVHTDYKPTRNG